MLSLLKWLPLPAVQVTSWINNMATAAILWYWRDGLKLVCWGNEHNGVGFVGISDILSMQGELWNYNKQSLAENTVYEGAPVWTANRRAILYCKWPQQLPYLWVKYLHFKGVYRNQINCNLWLCCRECLIEFLYWYVSYLWCVWWLPLFGRAIFISLPSLHQLPPVVIQLNMSDYLISICN